MKKEKQNKTQKLKAVADVKNLEIKGSDVIKLAVFIAILAFIIWVKLKVGR